MDNHYSNDELVDMAILGDKDAQFTLAYRYEEGIGAAPSLAKAYAWAYAFDSNGNNAFLNRLANKMTDTKEINSARVFAIKLERILNK